MLLRQHQQAAAPDCNQKAAATAAAVAETNDTATFGMNPCF
jgi:hypothetical protein